MRTLTLFGFTLALGKAADVQKQIGLSGLSNSRGGWLPIVFESFAGAWQQNVKIDRNTVLGHHAVFSCMTLIASDVSKLRPRLVERDDDGIWNETTNSAYSPVLRKPNGIQNRIQFLENWVLSKLSNGNVYVLKGRDARGVVTSLHILDPMRAQVLVSPDGEVFYRLGSDNISGLESDITVPAREIIHDRMNCLFHPLVGLSPITAAALAATQGMNIQQDAAQFFLNGAMPSGVLTAPGAIGTDTAKRLKDDWQEKFTGANAGKVAVLGDGLKFEQMRMQSTDAQLVEQLRWTAEVVCSVFHVPPYKIGGPMPSFNNIQALNVEYYSQTLQVLLEAIELALDEGLEIKDPLGTEFDLSDLLRMDTVTQVAAAKEAVGAGIMTPNEARLRLNLSPVDGGDSPMMQQQQFSLAALAERDQDKPFSKPTAAPAATPATPAAPLDSSARQVQAMLDRIESLERQVDQGMFRFRSVWNADESYRNGDFVSFAGSMWHCNFNHKGVKPGQGGGTEHYWKLAVKRGRDGKDPGRRSVRDANVATRALDTKADDIDRAWAEHEGAT